MDLTLRFVADYKIRTAEGLERQTPATSVVPVAAQQATPPRHVNPVFAHGQATGPTAPAPATWSQHAAIVPSAPPTPAAVWWQSGAPPPPPPPHNAAGGIADNDLIAALRARGIADTSIAALMHQEKGAGLAFPVPTPVAPQPSMRPGTGHVNVLSLAQNFRGLDLGNRSHRAVAAASPVCALTELGYTVTQIANARARHGADNQRCSNWINDNPVAAAAPMTSAAAPQPHAESGLTAAADALRHFSKVEISNARKQCGSDDAACVRWILENSSRADPHKGDVLFGALRDLQFTDLAIENAVFQCGNDTKACADWILTHEQAAKAPLHAPLQGTVAGVFQRLCEMGLKPVEARRKALEADKRSSTLLGGVRVALGVQDDEAVIQDPVLLDEVRMEEVFTFDCKHNHKMAYESALHSAANFLGREGVMPPCPFANQGPEPERCNHVMSILELEQVLNLNFAIDAAPPEDLIQSLQLECGIRENGRAGWSSRKANQLALRAQLQAEGYVECPAPNCATFNRPERPGRQERLECRTCRHVFCSLCARAHHYKAACAEMVTLARLWMEWRQTGQRAYLERMAATNAAYRTALTAFQGRAAAHEAEVALAQRNLATLQADEAWKVAHARLCPHCRRVVNRVDGCDAMVCGRNAHGGNQQNGCGQGYNWQQALPYQADMGNARAVPAFADAAPAEAAVHRHVNAATGAPIVCSECNAPVVGPMAECVHCPSHVRCLQCQVRPHDEAHVFRIIMA